MGQKSTTTTSDHDRLTTSVLAGTIAFDLALIIAAKVLSWPTQTVAGALQVLGIGLASFGLDVVRASLQRAANKAIAAKQGISRWAAIRREQLHRWWLRRRGRPIVYSDKASGGVVLVGGGSTTAKGERGRVNRDAVSDREWLVHLDDEVADLWTRMKRTEEARLSERAEIDDRLTADHDDLRAEIIRATRQGWELVVAGLIYSAIGTFVGIWA